MSYPTPSSSLVTSVLAGAADVAVGLSFVDEAALEGLRWGGRGMPGVAVAVCSRVAPDLAFVPSWKPWAAEAADRIAACGSAVWWAVPGPLGTVAERDGWPETLKRTLSDPSDLHADLERELPAVEEAVRRGASLGVDAIVVAEDIAGSEGMLVAPDYALDEVVPLLGRLAELAAEHSLPSILHSDGDIRPVLRAVRRVGFAGIHCGGLDETAFRHVFDAARGEGLAVAGGLPTSELEDGAMAAMGVGMRAGLLARMGGLLICDDGGITTSEQLAALFSAFSAARETADEA